MTEPIGERSIFRVHGTSRVPDTDRVALEEPLEIRLGYQENGQDIRKSISVTMRTPGHDRELAAGFLCTEGILRSPAEILAIRACAQPNTVRVDIREGVDLDLGRLQRHFYSSSSCGVCGKSSLDSVTVKGLAPFSQTGPTFEASLLHRIPERVRQAQAVFAQTGGLHAAALFEAGGELVSVFEDIGRHNAVDKIVGERFLAERLPLSNHLLFVSGRASFELVQKACVAGICCLAAVGAPSSLAVDLAKRFHMTLIGFLRDDRFNIYHGEGRVKV